MNDELLKIEIAIVDKDDREWQWLGKLSKKSLLLLTKMADSMSDADVEQL